MSMAPCRKNSSLSEAEGRSPSISIGVQCAGYPGPDRFAADAQYYDSLDDGWRGRINMYSSTANHSQGSGDLPANPETSSCYLNDFSPQHRRHADFYIDDEVCRSIAYQQPAQHAPALAGIGRGGSTTLLASLSCKPAGQSQTLKKAPSLSTLAPFTVAVTHIRLQRTRPSQAYLTCVRAFELLQQCGVSIQKVTPHKYTVKARFCASPGFECWLKVFIYSTDAESDDDTQAASQEGKGAVLEFQRRSGDCLAFNHLFRLMRRLLQKEEANDMIGWKLVKLPPFGLPAPAEASEDILDASTRSSSPFQGSGLAAGLV